MELSIKLLKYLIFKLLIKIANTIITFSLAVIWEVMLALTSEHQVKIK